MARSPSAGTAPDRLLVEEDEVLEFPGKEAGDSKPSLQVVGVASEIVDGNVGTRKAWE